MEGTGQSWPLPNGAVWGRMALRSVEWQPDMNALGRRINHICPDSCSLQYLAIKTIPESLVFAA